MPNYGYSYVEKKGVKFARAQVYDVDASFKDLCQVCNNVRGKRPDEALELLGRVSRLEFPIRYYSHNKKLGHRRELGGRKGRYPEKSAKIIIKLIKNALANASNRGMSDDLVIACACANKLRNYPRVAAKGRWSRGDYETARVEMVLEESPEHRKSFENKKKQAAEALKKGAKKADKPETKKQEKKQAKQETKPEPKKQEAKKPEPKAEAKKEAKKEEPTPKTEPKKEQVKEAKKEEEKAEPEKTDAKKS